MIYEMFIFYYFTILSICSLLKRWFNVCFIYWNSCFNTKLFLIIIRLSISHPVYWMWWFRYIFVVWHTVGRNWLNMELIYFLLNNWLYLNLCLNLIIIIYILFIFMFTESKGIACLIIVLSGRHFESIKFFNGFININLLPNKRDLYLEIFFHYLTILRNLI